MKLFKSIVLAAALVAAAIPASAAGQESVPFKGHVTDVSGAPLEGVTVMLVGETLVGTVTDAAGDFEMKAPIGAELRITSIGYAEMVVKVTGEPLSIVLKDDTQFLDEVVVVGYGTARKGDLTSQISSVASDKLVERGTAQVSTALQGQIAGVQVTRSNGNNSSAATIRIHGMTTMSDNDPLIIIDGVPGSLVYLDAEDIETISVLKDASAAAIYGARAAAGVILITTKRAKSDQFVLDYKYEYSFDRPTAVPEKASVVDFLNVFNEVRENDGSGPNSVYSKEFIENYMENNAKDPYHYPNTDWVGMMIKKSTAHQKHALSIAGGSERIKTKATFNYFTGDGYYDGNEFNRYSGRVNSDMQINSWMKASLDLQYHYNVIDDIPAGNEPGSGIIDKAYGLPQIYTAKWADGTYADVKDGNNILPLLEAGGFVSNKHYGLQGKAQLDITPFKGMTLSGIFSPNYNFSRAKTFKKRLILQYEDGKACNSLEQNATSLEETRGYAESYTYQALANYQNRFGDHSLNAMLGYEGFTYYHEAVKASRLNYTLTNFPYLDLGPEDFQYNSGDASHNSYLSVFGRVIYSFKNRYLLQASVRYDGSSRFASKYRWGIFPSFSLGWVVSDEPWFNNKGLVNYFKLRASMGSLGNERLGSDFPYQAAMEFGTVYLRNNGAKAVEAVQSARQTHYAYEDLTWETTTTYGAGIDAAFFDSRLTATVDAYYKKTEGMLLAVGFPSYYGYSSPQANAGDMHTYGYDIELGWKDRVGDFWYSLSANLSDYRSIMGYLGDKKTVSGNTLYEEGSYFQEWYMYKTDGLVQTEEDLKLPSLTSVNMLGFIKYVDVNEDGKVNADDKVRLGNSRPEYLFGGNIALGYKNFDFGLQFQGIGHQRVLFNSTWIQPIRDQYKSVPQNLMGNYWSKYNTDEQNAKVKYPLVTFTYRSATTTGSDYWLFNGGYFRVKNIVLGYTFPKRITDSLKMKGLRVYANITDLPAISNYPKGIDPEWSWGGVYISTTATLGVNVKF